MTYEELNKHIIDKKEKIENLQACTISLVSDKELSLTGMVDVDRGEIIRFTATINPPQTYTATFKMYSYLGTSPIIGTSLSDPSGIAIFDWLIPVAEETIPTIPNGILDITASLEGQCTSNELKVLVRTPFPPLLFWLALFGTTGLVLWLGSRFPYKIPSNGKT